MTREPKALCERIGQRIRERRDGLRLSLDDLALRMEMSKSGLWDIERGIHEPKAGTILRLCRVLECSADWLLGVDEEETGK